MKLVSTAAQVREMDRRTIEDLGLPGVALMETASRAVAEVVATRFGDAARRGVVVVCGAGNNGGDGWACARWLHAWGFPVAVWSLGEAAGDAAVMRAVAERIGVPRREGLGDCGLVVDAVFGTGLSRPVQGAARAAIEAMNAHGAPIVAVDVPSGLSADSGLPLGLSVRADCTVTFGRLKPGLLGEPGADLAGRVEVVDIGIEVAGGDAVAEVPDAVDLGPRWPRRPPGAYKTGSGHLLVVAGSTAMAGAAALVCRGALAAGAGLVTLCAPRGAIPRLGALAPEVMLLVGGEGDRLASLPDLEGKTALAAGPGLGGGAPLPPGLADALRDAWRALELPVVFDADALACADGDGPAPRVLTPHPGEAARLLGRPVADVQRDRLGAAGALAVGGRVALLKGRNTVVAQAGERASINPTGHEVLATGGTGDVLTGVVGALLARGVGARDAARLAAWVHGRAGERLAARRSQGWRASDVADEIPAAVEELLACARS